MTILRLEHSIIFLKRHYSCIESVKIIYDKMRVRVYLKDDSIFEKTITSNRDLKKLISNLKIEQYCYNTNDYEISFVPLTNKKLNKALKHNVLHY